MLFDLLGGTTAIELAQGKISLEEAAQQGVLGKATEILEQATDPLGDEFAAFGSTVAAESEAFVDAIRNAPASLAESLGKTGEELVQSAEQLRSRLVEDLENAAVFVPGLEQIEQGMLHTKQAQRHGARSLALGYGGREPDNLLREEEPTEGDEGGGEP